MTGEVSYAGFEVVQPAWFSGISAFPQRATARRLDAQAPSGFRAG
jgi:hypothetical protein